MLLLALIMLSRLSILEEELERLRLEARLTSILELTELRRLSMLEEELERLRLEV